MGVGSAALPRGRRGATAPHGPTLTVGDSVNRELGWPEVLHQSADEQSTVRVKVASLIAGRSQEWLGISLKSFYFCS
jgi:hypothetical protein